MKDKDKTKEQLITELVELRQKITELEKLKKTLQKNEEKLNAMLRSIGDHMSMMDKDLNILWSNKTAKKIFGKDIIGKKCYEVYHQRKKPCEPYPCLTLKAFQDGKVHQHDTQVIDKDGKIIYFHCTANVALKDEEGKPIAAIEISRDITEHKQAEKALKQSEEKLKSILNTMSDYCYIVSKEFKIEFMNKAMIERFGDQTGKICYKVFFNRKSPCTWDKLKEIQKGETVKWERYFPKWGSTLEIIDSPIKNKDGTISKLAIGRDISEHKQTEERLTYLATRDLLTGFPNRTLFDDRLTLAIAHAQRSKKKLTVILFDLDKFKEVNDTMGHKAGDQLLKAVSKRMKNLLRKSDTIARMGGDEFLFLLPEISHIEDATKIAQKIIDSFKSPFTIDHQKIHITTSIGIVLYPQDGEDADTLIKNADIAMYQAKKEGWNNYQFYKKLI